MSNAARHVRVDIRHVEIAEAAPCEESEAGVFITLDDPPPVRSILAVREGNDAPRAFEVTAVVEVAPEGGARGFHGRFIESDALARYERVGTEHLSDGEPEETDEAGGEHTIDDDDDGPGTHMAMPAPVVDPDESEPIDIDEARASAADDHGHEVEEPEASGEEGNGGDDGEARKGKRRRGRKRR